MKSIKSLIEELNLLRNSWEYKSLSLVDEHMTLLENRINNIEKRSMRYFCSARATIVQTIPTGVATAVTFNTTEYPQFGNMHDNVRDNDKVFIRRNGVYSISCGFMFELGVGAPVHNEIMLLGLFRNGVQYYIGIDQYHQGHPVYYRSMDVAIDYYCYEMDILQMFVYHDTGVMPLDSYVGNPLHRSVYLSASERMEDLNPSQYGLLNPEQNMR